MRLMFVYYIMKDAGSAQDIHYYTEEARALGHEVVLYGPPDNDLGFNCSRDVDSADAVVFIFEWTTQLRYGDELDLLRLMHKVPRGRRIVIDCDGNYNDALNVGGDYNHRDAEGSRRWIDSCDSLADRIFQPTLHPLRSNVRPFFFHGYDPAWEQPLHLRGKEYGMVYVGHSKFRWGPMKRVLEAVEPVQDLVGRLAVVGHGWDSMPPWAASMQIEDYYYTDPNYLKKLKVEFVPPIPFDQVIPWMSKALFNPVIYRPLFEHLQFVTCRTFETPAANTVPLFALGEEYVREIYGEAGTELLLPIDEPHEKILDLSRRPDYYADVVKTIRLHLGEKHSYRARIRELIEIVTNQERPAAIVGASA
jgi:hypothetical protein